MVATREDPVVTDDTFREDFSAFYERERTAVTGLAYVLSGSRTGADDLAQDAFVEAYRRWDRISQYDKPGAWVRRVVANRSVSTLRRKTAEARALVRLAGAPPVVSELSPDVIATWEAVRSLPDRQAQVIALRYYDRSSIPEIAQILDLTENTVKTHLRRAKATLSERLSEEDSP